MSNPNETNDHSLISNTFQVQQADAGAVQQPKFTHCRSERSSPLSSGGLETKTTSKNRRRTCSRLEPSSKHHPVTTKSKQHSTASPEIMASSPSSVNYTRTGRISKAKKGLKVHNCEHCGRSYTRAEHLRRHQRNHAKDGALVCDFPDCDKVFYRIDLLQRHQERHNDARQVSRRASASSPDQERSPELPKASRHENIGDSMVATLPAGSSFHTPQPLSPIHDSPTITSQAKHRRSFASHNSAVIQMQVDGTTSSLGWADFYSQSSGYSSSDDYVSPKTASNDYGSLFPQMPYCPDSNRTRASSNASLIEPPWSYASRSPASTISTMAYPWVSSDKTSDAPALTYIDTTYPMTSMPIASSIDPMAGICQYDAKTMIQRDEEESVTLFGEQPYGMGPIAHTYPFEQDLDCYWRYFHPTFPIIHRPTFQRLTASPMLHAAMIAIGGQYSIDGSVRRRSRNLHDRCLKLLGRRGQVTMMEPERLMDYQAIFLIEYLSQFRSRRSAKVLSAHFEKVYQKSFLDFQHMNSFIAKLASPPKSDDATSDQWAHWVELTGSRRLLQACYILESQQALLLAREPKPSLIQASGYDLPFPVPIEIWDADSTYEWKLAQQVYPAAPLYVYEISPDVISRPLDTFQSSMLLAAYYNCFDMGAPYALGPPTFDLECHLDASPGIVRQHLTAKLVHVTPIRALLAIPGESWIFSERVSSLQAFGLLRTTVRAWLVQLWATDSTLGHAAPIKEALRLSVTILEAALREAQSPMKPEIGTDLGIFFAALVLWAVTAAATTRFKEVVPQRLQTPCYIQQPLASSNSPTVSGSPSPLLHPSLAQSPLAIHAASQPTLGSMVGTPISPPSQMAHDDICLLSHDDIATQSMAFLASALTDYQHAASQKWTASDLVRCQMGCLSLLLWVKMRLRGVCLEESTESWSSSASGGLGELLNGVITMLEKMLGRGWSEWGI